MKVIKEFDTIIIPAKEDGFQREFINNNRWYAVSISSQNTSKLKYIAAYRVAPISAITHYAEIDKIERYKDTEKYILFFKNTAKELRPIKLGSSYPPQNARYTTLKKLLEAE